MAKVKVTGMCVTTSNGVRTLRCELQDYSNLDASIDLVRFTATRCPASVLEVLRAPRRPDWYLVGYQLVYRGPSVSEASARRRLSSRTDDWLQGVAVAGREIVTRSQETSPS
jgi:hypothetical protein